MRRIDMICKLVGPLFIALIDSISTRHAILINFAMNATSVLVEYFTIASVYYEVPELQGAKEITYPSYDQSEAGQLRDQAADRPGHSRDYGLMFLRKSVSDFVSYFHHSAFLPSFAGALLYLTVLSFGGQMVTYLLSAGYSSPQIGIARTLSVGCEVLATWAAPWLMGTLGPVRAGIWLSSWQLVMLASGMAVFIVYEDKPVISATGLVGGTILSRLGLRGFDLCVQLLVQEVRAV